MAATLWRPVELTGWGRTTRAAMLACAPVDATAAAAALGDPAAGALVPMAAAAATATSR